jgi:hypothetical protein
MTPTKEVFMSTHAFDAFVRQAATGVSRRASLRILGGAPLAAALMGPSIVGAKKSGKKGKQGKKGKKGKKKAQQKAQQQCRAQVEQCRAYLTGACGSSPDPGDCEARNSPCCEHLGSCDAAGFFSCLTEASQTP